MSQRFVQNPWLTDVFTTTNATPATSGSTSYSVPSGVGGYVEMLATARNTATNVSASAKVARTFQTPGGVLTLTGSLITLVGTAGALVGDATLVTALAGLAVSGSIVQPQVTGILATNIEWMLDVRYWIN